jgi:hypothetical protein
MRQAHAGIGRDRGAMSNDTTGPQHELGEARQLLASTAAERAPAGFVNEETTAGQQLIQQLTLLNGFAGWVVTVEENVATFQLPPANDIRVQAQVSYTLGGFSVRAGGPLARGGGEQVALEFDPGTRTYVSSETDRYRSSQPGEPITRQRSAVAVLVEGMLKQLPTRGPR